MRWKQMFLFCEQNTAVISKVCAYVRGCFDLETAD